MACAGGCRNVNLNRHAELFLEPLVHCARQRMVVDAGIGLPMPIFSSSAVEHAEHWSAHFTDRGTTLATGAPAAEAFSSIQIG